MASYQKIANIKGPKGDQGDRGPAVQAEVRSTTQVPAGEPASVEVENTPDGRAILDVTIPRGPSGDGTGATDADFASEINTTGSATRTALNAASVVRQREVVLNVQHFGAAGNNVDDDTDTIQAAIDHAESVGGTVYLPPGRYKVLGTLMAPRRLSMATWIKNQYPWSTPEGTDATIVTTGALAFAPKDTVNGHVFADVQGITFRQEGSALGSLFGGGMNLRESNISGISAIYYNRVFDCEISLVSTIEKSFFNAIKDAFHHGNLVDSRVKNNYISGYSQAGYNPRAFTVSGTWSTSTVSENFIEFMKHGLRVDTAPSGRIGVIDNVFDYCYQAVGARIPETGRGASLSGFKISLNTFHRIAAAHRSAYFSAPDAEMLAQPWTAISAPYGLIEASIIGNLFRGNDRGILVDSYPNHDINEQGNTWRDTPVRVRYSAYKSGSSNDQNRIYFESLDNQRVTTLPSPTLTGSGITTFDRQWVIHNGKPVFNDNGTWRDFSGATVT